MSDTTVHVNGTPATVETLTRFMFAGFAHFTAMQVRQGAVRGLDLHLRRLREASDELFGTHMPDVEIVSALSSALDAHFAPSQPTATPEETSAHAYTTSERSVSLSCFIAPTSGGPSASLADRRPVPLDVIVKIGPAHELKPTSLAFDVVEHQRHLPAIKHVGEVAKTHYLRTARTKGFDDAAFVDQRGRLSEATIWNLAFFDGRSVIWPEAQILPGVTMQILRRQLQARGVPQSSRAVTVSTLAQEGLAAVAMNSWTSGVPIDRLGGVCLTGDGEAFAHLLREAYASEPPQRVG